MSNLAERFKDSLQSKLGNETIGDLGFNLNRPDEVSEKREKIKKPKKKLIPSPKPKLKKKPIPKKEEIYEEDYYDDEEDYYEEDTYNSYDDFEEIEENFFEEDKFEFKEIKDFDIPDLEYPSSKKSFNPSNYPVLELLGIDKDIDISDFMTEQDVEDVEFSLTAPTGINPTEVEAFCNKVERQFNLYRTLLLSRQEDFMKLLQETVKLESKLVERKHESELTNFLMDQKSNEEVLKEQIVELRLENQELKMKMEQILANQEKQSKDLAMREMAYREKSNSTAHSNIAQPLKKAKLPTREIEEKDDFTSLLDDLDY